MNYNNHCKIKNSLTIEIEAEAEEVEVEVREPTTEDVKKAVKNLKNNKELMEYIWN